MTVKRWTPKELDLALHCATTIPALMVDASDYDALAKQLSDVQESKWVSVAERLPANAQEVWCVVQLQDGERERLVRRATYFEGTGWFKLGFDANLVTHWQSQFTPQPPKPEEKPL